MKTNGDDRSRSGRLLVLALGGGYGGAERSLEQLLGILAVHREITVLVEQERHADVLRKLGLQGRVQVVHVKGGRSPWRMVWLCLRFLYLAWTQRAGTLVTNTNKSAVLLAGCLRFLPRRMNKLVFVRDFQWIHARWCFERLAGKAKIVAPSKVVFERWPSDYGCLPSESERAVLPNPFRVPEEVHDQDHKEILCLSSQSRWKGLDVLIRAMPKILKLCPEARLRIVGEEVDKEYSKELELLIHELGLRRRVTRQGFVEDPAFHLRHCSCVVSASLTRLGGPETFGRTVIEGWAFAKPVVATRGGGPEALIEDRNTGILVPPDDAEALGTALSEVLCDHLLAERLGRSGRKEFLDKYSDIAVAAELEALIGCRQEQIPSGWGISGLAHSWGR